MLTQGDPLELEVVLLVPIHLHVPDKLLPVFVPLAFTADKLPPDVVVPKF